MPKMSRERIGTQNGHATHTRSNIATFVEMSNPSFVESESLGSDTIAQTILDKHTAVRNAPATMQVKSAGTDRKKPRASVAEKKWREQQRLVIAGQMNNPSKIGGTGNSIHGLPSQWNHDSEQLAMELEQAALEMTMDSRTLTRDKDPKEPNDDDPKLRTFPTFVVDEDMDYVYDTYIRQPVETPHTATETPIHDKRKMPPGQYGVLVINDEDKQLWETYAEDEDTEWEEEDADSNGKVPCYTYEAASLSP